MECVTAGKVGGMSQRTRLIILGVSAHALTLCASVRALPVLPVCASARVLSVLHVLRAALHGQALVPSPLTRNPTMPPLRTVCPWLEAKTIQIIL